MKNVKITFRLSPYQLARGLQTMKQLDQNYQLISIHDMVKTIYHDYLSKMSLNKTSDVPMSFVVEVQAHLESCNAKLTMENLFVAPQAVIKEKPSLDFKALDEDVYDPDEELSAETLAEIDQMINQTKRLSAVRKSSEFHDPNNTESDISTLTNFSPPEDWME